MGSSERGVADFGPRGNLEGLERFVPDLTVERVPDGSHWVVHEHPELINRVIRDFLGRRDSMTMAPR